jgi:hypothetical protein
MLPYNDFGDFDGFMQRRVARGLSPCPPQMKQASLVKNAISMRRDSAKATLKERLGKKAEGGLESGTLRAAVNQDDKMVFSFTYDATKTGTLTLHLMVKEQETLLDLSSHGSNDADNSDGVRRRRGKRPTSVRLVSRDPPLQHAADKKAKPEDEKGEHAEEDRDGIGEERPTDKKELLDAPIVETRRITVGMGHVYESPPLDLKQWPFDQLTYDAERPKDVPIAVKLEADVEDGEQPSIQYTYISVHSVPSDSPSSGPQLSTNVYSQKLQYGEQCFVLHEVFGVNSKFKDEAEVEGGNSDCVICLTEPRDTAVLPCRHMCFCSYCAGIVRLQCDKCPVCRQKVQSLLQFKREEDENGDEVLTGFKEVPASASPAAVDAVSSGAGSSSAVAA